MSCVPVSLCPCAPVSLCPVFLCSCVECSTLFGAMHRQGEWTTNSIQLPSHLSSFWISGGNCLGLTSNAWTTNNIQFHKGHVTQTSTHQSVSPHLTAIHRKVTDPAHNVPVQNVHVCTYVRTCRPMYIYKLFGDTSRSHDS